MRSTSRLAALLVTLTMLLSGCSSGPSFDLYAIAEQLFGQPALETSPRIWTTSDSVATAASRFEAAVPARPAQKVAGSESDEQFLGWGAGTVHISSDANGRTQVSVDKDNERARRTHTRILPIGWGTGSGWSSSTGSGGFRGGGSSGGGK